MSDATKDALDAAIAAHFGDEFGGSTYVAEWVIVAYGQDPESADWRYLREWPETQPSHHTQGLLDRGAYDHRRFTDALMTDSDDEDD